MVEEKFAVCGLRLGAAAPGVGLREMGWLEFFLSTDYTDFYGLHSWIGGGWVLVGGFVVVCLVFF
jgi:hypothetical protein